MKNKQVILIVDDEPTNRTLLKAYLIPEGYEIVEAENGEEALKTIGANTVDLVLLDVMMPRVDGFEVCRRIKGDEKFSNIPVVMLTALSAKEDRIKGIEAGAEDFISKPIDRLEVLARVRMLLKLKILSDRLIHTYKEINNMMTFGVLSIESFDPLNFAFLPKVDDIVNQLIRKASDQYDKPQLLIVGVSDESHVWQWYQYEYAFRVLNRTLLTDVYSLQSLGKTGNSRVVFYNKTGRDQPEFQLFVKTLASLSIAVSNTACYLSESLCIFAVNYGRDVTPYDASVLNSVVVQSLFLKSLSSQISETESAFKYMVDGLARASEANDEDTGNHILRVGDYSALIAEGLGMTEKFIEAMRVQAALHDVGKIHVHPDILKKPGKLTPEEWGEMKKHTLYGARIIGNHPRLIIGNKIASSHHERWDGSGYPYGLEGEQIHIEGRILTIGDQYDALRNKRSYKLAFDHATAYKIIVNGDGRTLPAHFDPKVLRMFKKLHRRFEEIYEKRYQQQSVFEHGALIGRGLEKDARMRELTNMLSQ
jgi:response regulator RpfG family c-di-GMP phosphodiesterase